MFYLFWYKYHYMKFSLTFILSFLIICGIKAQQTEAIPYCDCVDKVEQIKPILNGKFQRTCKGVIIETGTFKNGNKDGEWITYNKKSVVIRRINYNDGKLNGKFEAYDAKGALKVTAYFKDDVKTDKWVYYIKKDKPLITGEFDNGKPINVWTVNDAKGNKPAIQFDYLTGKYLKNEKVSLYHNNSIIQNDNTAEYFIFWYPKRRVKEDATMPIGGYYFTADIFAYLVEVPQDYWDTYINYNYIARFKIGASGESSFTLTRREYKDPTPETDADIPYLIETNPSSKIKRVDHSELSRLLLNYKIKEAVSVLPPWVFKDKAEVNLDVSYVVNRIIDFSKPVDKEYN